MLALLLEQVLKVPCRDKLCRLRLFRGLTFTNFRRAADADAVITALNGFDVQGRPYSTVILNNMKNRSISIYEGKRLWVWCSQVRVHLAPVV